MRRVLQALPYPPSDERLATIKASISVDVFGSPSASNSTANLNLSGKIKLHKKDKDKDKEKDKGDGKVAERRRKVEHWVPAIWIPDGKTASCMRCGRMFGWRRRRHHCRLCGRCVCAGCSGQVCLFTFLGLV